MGEEIPDGPVDPGPTLPALPSRVLLAIVSPGGLFEALRREPAAWGALLLGAVLLSLSSLALPLEVWEETIRLQMLEADRELPIDPATAARLAKVAATLGSLVAWPLMGAISAGIFALLFLFALGYEGSYRQYLAVTAHALLVVAIAAVVLLPLRILTQDAQFSLTLAVALPGLEDGLIARFLRTLDLFNLWAYALIGLGAAVVDGTRKPGASVAIAVGSALLLSLLIASITG